MTKVITPRKPTKKNIQGTLATLYFMRWELDDEAQADKIIDAFNETFLTEEKSRQVFKDSIHKLYKNADDSRMNLKGLYHATINEVKSTDLQISKYLGEFLKEEEKTRLSIWRFKDEDKNVHYGVTPFDEVVVYGPIDKTVDKWVVPQKLHGLDVKILSLQSDIDIKNNDIKSVELPEGLRSINQEFFYDWDKLETVDFKEGLQQIAAMAFYNTKIENIHLPDSIEYISTGAFMKSSLKEVDLSNCHKLKEIGDEAFYDNNITKVSLSPKLQKVNGGAFMENNVNYLTIFPNTKYDKESFDQSLIKQLSNFNKTMPEREEPNYDYER